MRIGLVPDGAIGCLGSTGRSVGMTIAGTTDDAAGLASTGRAASGAGVGLVAGFGSDAARAAGLAIGFAGSRSAAYSGGTSTAFMTCDARTAALTSSLLIAMSATR